MLDKSVLDEIEAAVDQYRKLKAEKAANDNISEDLLDLKLEEIGDVVSLSVFQAVGLNEYRLDKVALGQLGGEHYSVKLNGRTPIVIVNRIGDDDNDDEISILEPREE